MRAIKDTLVTPMDISEATIEHMITKLESMAVECVEYYERKSRVYYISVPSQLLLSAAMFQWMHNKNTGWDEGGVELYVDLNVEYGADEWSLTKIVPSFGRETTALSVVSKG